MHRLWYDLRVQSMFDARLRDAVLTVDTAIRDMIWRIVTRYSELADREVAMDPASAYGVLDGLFEAALLGHVTGNPEALPRLVVQVHSADAADAEPAAAGGGLRPLRTQVFSRDARMSALSTLPTFERGRSAQTSTCLGALTLPIRSLTNAASSSGATGSSPRSCTTAVTRSPHFSSGSPTTAQSWTAGCCIRACSTSVE